MENFNVQPPQYNQYEQMSKPASAAGRNDSPELQEANGLALGSMICGIVGLALCELYGLGALVGGVGLVLAIIAGKKGNTSGKRKVGMILSIVAIAIGVLIFFVLMSLFSLTRGMNY